MPACCFLYGLVIFSCLKADIYITDSPGALGIVKSSRGWVSWDHEVSKPVGRRPRSSKQRVIPYEYMRKKLGSLKQGFLSSFSVRPFPPIRYAVLPYIPYLFPTIPSVCLTGTKWWFRGVRYDTALPNKYHTVAETYRYPKNEKSLFRPPPLLPFLPSTDIPSPRP